MHNETENLGTGIKHYNIPTESSMSLSLWEAFFLEFWYEMSNLQLISLCILKNLEKANNSQAGTEEACVKSMITDVFAT